jgi:hypothetical protein
VHLLSPASSFLNLNAGQTARGRFGATQARNHSIPEAVSMDSYFMDRAPSRLAEVSGTASQSVASANTAMVARPRNIGNQKRRSHVPRRIEGLILAELLVKAPGAYYPQGNRRDRGPEERRRPPIRS